MRTIKLELFLSLSAIFLITTTAYEENFNDFQSIEKSSKIFATDIYKKFLPISGNIIFSPWSLQTILVLLQLGSKGLSLKQLSSVLHMPVNKHEILSIFGKIETTLRNRSNITLTSANKIYTRRDITILNEFAQLAYNFNTEFYNSSSNSNPIQIANDINQWVQYKTNNKIRDIIRAEDLSEDTLIILMNILYFNGKWAAPFEKDFTQPKLFYANGDVAINVPMMLQVGNFQYGEQIIDNIEMKFIRLPYLDDDFHMVIVLPNDRQNLPKLEMNLQAIFNSNFNSIMSIQSVIVQIPKFTIEKQIEFSRILTELGLKSLFHKANLSAMTNHKALAVSKVIQKCFVEVNEEGTEAAAASGITIEDRFGNYDRKVFIADHPFMFFIEQKSSGIILFIGRYSQP